jgi:hypothetical protein
VQTYGFKVVDLFSAPYLAQDHVLVMVQFRRNDQGYGLSDNFCSRVAEQFFSAAVPTGNDPIQVLAGDGVI